MRLVAVLVCGLSLGWGTAAVAAPPARGAPAPEQPMQVYLVRSAQPGCEPHCPEWISAQGKIEAGSVKRFEKILRQVGDRKLPVLIDSSGGKVHEAFKIGRLARAKGLDVVVTRTIFTPCAPSDAACRRAKTGGVVLGLPQAPLSKCASSCAFVLAGGARRLVGPSTFVGVHQIRSFYVYARILRTYRVTPSRKTLVSERKVAQRVVETRTSQKTYDQIRQYFAEMGIREAIMPLILSTPSDKLHLLTRNELELTGLGTDWVDGEQLLAKAAVSAVPLADAPRPHARSPAEPADAPPSAASAVGPK
jgi:hypothetical protein